MPLDMPPVAPPPAAYVAPAPECQQLSAAQARAALERLRKRLPSTAFADVAIPSEVCGLARLQLARGNPVYTDANGRYLMFLFALDTQKGSPADIETKLDDALEKRTTFPEQAVPGVMPGPAQ